MTAVSKVARNGKRQVQLLLDVLERSSACDISTQLRSQLEGSKHAGEVGGLKKGKKLVREYRLSSQQGVQLPFRRPLIGGL